MLLLVSLVARLDLTTCQHGSRPCVPMKVNQVARHAHPGSPNCGRDLGLEQSTQDCDQLLTQILTKVCYFRSESPQQPWMLLEDWGTSLPMK